jgi:hypothetical protein
LKLAAWANCKKKERWGKRRKEEGGEGCTMGSCNQQSRLGVLCIAACVSVCILLAVPSVLCFATRVSLVEEEGARGGGGGGGAAATAIIQEKPLPFIVLHGIGDECKNHGLYQFTQLLINTSGAVGFCIEIGDGAGDSFFMRLDKQVGNDEAPSFFCPPFWNLENQSTAISIDSFGRHRKTAKFQFKKMHHFFKTL